MKDRKTSGPKPERLKIDGDWKKAVGKVVKAPKPAAETKKGAK